jgi:hypothetical protein
MGHRGQNLIVSVLVGLEPCGFSLSTCVFVDKSNKISLPRQKSLSGQPINEAFQFAMGSSFFFSQIRRSKFIICSITIRKGDRVPFFCPKVTGIDN